MKLSYKLEKKVNNINILSGAFDSFEWEIWLGDRLTGKLINIVETRLPCFDLDIPNAQAHLINVYAFGISNKNRFEYPFPLFISETI